jgi:hypothetical protein
MVGVCVCMCQILTCYYFFACFSVHFFGAYAASLVYYSLIGVFKDSSM